MLGIDKEIKGFFDKTGRQYEIGDFVAIPWTNQFTKIIKLTGVYNRWSLTLVYDSGYVPRPIQDHILREGIKLNIDDWPK